MKKTLLLSLGLIFLGFQAIAQDLETTSITYVDGSGYSSGSCSSNDYFCLRNLTERSERDGLNQAQLRCSLNQGTPLLYTANCNTYCSPNYIPPNTTTFVSCRSTCRMQCEVKP